MIQPVKSQSPRARIVIVTITPMPTLPADPLFWHIAYRRKIINRRQDGTRA